MVALLRTTKITFYKLHCFQIAWRACLLEQENASLRAHVNMLRQEALALRALLAARDETPLPTSTTAD